jgi:hypothetical protein
MKRKERLHGFGLIYGHKVIGNGRHPQISESGPIGTVAETALEFHDHYANPS